MSGSSSTGWPPRPLHQAQGGTELGWVHTPSWVWGGQGEACGLAPHPSWLPCSLAMSPGPHGLGEEPGVPEEGPAVIRGLRATLGRAGQITIHRPTLSCVGAFHCKEAGMHRGFL